MTEHACHDVRRVKACTRAGTSCGSCIPLVKKVMGAEMAKAGVALSQGAVRALRAVAGPSCSTPCRSASCAPSARSSRRFGTGRGCDICKPVVASVLASLYDEHVLAGEPGGAAGHQRPGHGQHAEGRHLLGRAAGARAARSCPSSSCSSGRSPQDYGLYTKITGGQRIDLFGARLEQLPAIWQRLVDAGGWSRGTPTARRCAR